MSAAPDPERMRFVDWMAHALYDPECGYYARHVRAVGPRGDFSTSATVGPALGEAIADWIRNELAANAREVRTIIEIGGGDGSLSGVVRRSLGWWQRRRLRWCMVETSAPLRAQQEAKLGTKHVRWFTGVSDALKGCDGQALIFHNEVLDAFPVTILQWNAARAQWQELWLRKEGGVWHEMLEPIEAGLMDGISLSPASWESVPLRDGQRIEIGTACREWLQGWAQHWKEGTMLTLDYGDAFPPVYTRQPRGTLRAYLKQQRLTDLHVYENMGRQDITADVNFTDLMNWGEQLGWETVRFLTQRQFLSDHAPDMETRARQDPGAAFLLDEHGAGEAFKALIQRPTRCLAKNGKPFARRVARC